MPLVGAALQAESGFVWSRLGGLSTKMELESP